MYDSSLVCLGFSELKKLPGVGILLIVVFYTAGVIGLYYGERISGALGSVGVVLAIDYGSGDGGGTSAHNGYLTGFGVNGGNRTLGVGRRIGNLAIAHLGKRVGKGGIAHGLLYIISGIRYAAIGLGYIYLSATSNGGVAFFAHLVVNGVLASIGESWERREGVFALGGAVLNGGIGRFGQRKRDGMLIAIVGARIARGYADCHRRCQNSPWPKR